jgi:hypothetical protein
LSSNCSKQTVFTVLVIFCYAAENIHSWLG